MSKNKQSKVCPIFKIRYENSRQNRTKAKVSFISFVPLGDCTDIAIEESGGIEKDFYAYITAKDKVLYIRNVTDPVFSYHVGTCDIPGYAYGIGISGDYAFVADGGKGLQVIDVTDKEGPVIIGSCDTPGTALGVVISGEYAFVADGYSGLQIIDVSKKERPKIIGFCGTPGEAYGVGISKDGQYAFVTNDVYGLQVIDIGDKENPVIVGSCDTPGFALLLAISGNYAFVADDYGGLPSHRHQRQEKPYDCWLLRYS